MKIIVCKFYRVANAPNNALTKGNDCVDELNRRNSAISAAGPAAALYSTQSDVIVNQLDLINNPVINSANFSKDHIPYSKTNSRATLSHGRQPFVDVMTGITAVTESRYAIVYDISHPIYHCAIFSLRYQ